jgi:HD-GYP domain-containing protein (c-di-GMP phosphodiesterase class II)
MFGSLDRLGSVRRRIDLRRQNQETTIVPEHNGSTAVRIWRYLPLAVIATGSVIALPGALVAIVVPWSGVFPAVICAALAMALSIAVASAEAALWARRRRSRDLLFADLMLWGWVRRCWTERRLVRARELYESARKAGPGVSVDLLRRLSERLEARDAYTHGHSRRVARHAGRMARSMHLSPTEIAKIRTAAAVHDVGKLYTPREILNNPGRLTDGEFAIVKLHPGDGANMLAEVGDPEIAAMVRHHHERVDGCGYPDGLTGSEIPLGARIIAVADTFDAITSSRAYRRAGTHKKALDILSQEAGSQLDAAAVAAFLHGYSARRSLALLAFATAIPERIFAGLQAASSSLGVGAAGTASILPAVGAAGLFAFAPSLHRGTPVQRAHHRAIVAVYPHATPPARTTVATRRIRQAGSIRPAATVRHGSHRAVPVSPPTTTPRRTTGGKPTTAKPTTATQTGSGEPAAGTPTTSQTTTTPPPTTTSQTPPPAPEAPALPQLPVNLPVTVPSITIPSLPLPIVK